MKAYSVSDRNGDEGYSLVVFAETAGKAKAYAAGTDKFYDYGFTGIRAIRQPMLANIMIRNGTKNHVKAVR